MAYSKYRKALYERDFWLFCREVMQYEDLMAANKDWCRDLQESWHLEQRKVLLKPRKTYKTSIYVIALACWIFVRDPDMTVMLVSGTAGKAKENYRAIKNHLQSNERILECWGRLWDDGKGKFTNDGIWHRYRSRTDPNYQTPNLWPIGKGAVIAGRHFDLIICDDIVTEKDRDSAGEREKTKQYFRQLQPILAGRRENGGIILVGTRWHFDDLYAYIEQDVNKRLPQKKKYVYEVEALYEIAKEDLRHGVMKYKTDGRGRFKLRFPEKCDYEWIENERKTMGEPDFYAQYLNNPTPLEAVGFPRDNMTLFKPNELKHIIKDLDIVTYWDPATSEHDTAKVCYSAIITVGFHRTTHEVYVLGATLEKMNTVAGVQRVREHMVAYHPRVLGFEASGDPVLLEKELRKMLLDNDIMRTRLRKVSVYHGGHRKDARIEMMSNLYDLGLLKFREDWKSSGRWRTYHLLVEQLVNWPLHQYKDGPDGLAGAIELLGLERLGKGISVRNLDKPRVRRGMKENLLQYQGTTTIRGSGGAHDAASARYDDDRKSRARRARRARKGIALDPRLHDSVSGRRRR